MGEKLSMIQNSRQMLRVFGGLNETYECSEAEMSAGVNFSSRGYPALQTRKPRCRVRAAERVHGMYHLNGILSVEGTTLIYRPEDGGQETVLENAVADTEKQLVGMGTKVLIWPDKLAFDTADGSLGELGAEWKQSAVELEVRPCDSAGVTYQVDVCQDEEPDEPTNGMIWLKPAAQAPWGYESALKIYSAAGSWQTLLLNWLRLESAGIGKNFKAGDTVTLEGLPAQAVNAYAEQLGGEVSIDEVEEDALILALNPNTASALYYGTMKVTAESVVWTSLDGKQSQAFDSKQTAARVERKVPDLDYLTECDNRIWGCSSAENVIYACKLGDATNWYSYRGTAADSYAVTVGSEGAFTGAATCLGYVLFFKENGIHRLYGTKPSDYQMSAVKCAGVAKGAARSLCLLNETLFYLSYEGVMLWDGSLPEKISRALKTEALVSAKRAVGGSLAGRYYLYLEQEDTTARLLVYDAALGLWHEEDAMGREMCSTGRQLILWDGEALWYAQPESGSNGEAYPAAFEAVTGELGLSMPDDKYISRATVRLDAGQRTVVTVWISCDGEEWREVGRAEVAGTRERINLPFAPTRCDSFRLRITGTGEIAVRSIALTLADATGARVNGAGPRR